MRVQHQRLSVLLDFTFLDVDIQKNVPKLSWVVTLHFLYHPRFQPKTSISRPRKDVVDGCYVGVWQQADMKKYHVINYQSHMFQYYYKCLVFSNFIQRNMLISTKLETKNDKKKRISKIYPRHFKAFFFKKGPQRPLLFQKTHRVFHIMLCLVKRKEKRKHGENIDSHGDDGFTITIQKFKLTTIKVLK